MPRRMVAPIVSEKHYFQNAVTTVVSGALTAISPIVCVAVASKDAPNEVEEGSVIKAFYQELWILSDDAPNTSFTITVEKRQGPAATMTFTQSQNLNVYENKRNILYTTQGLANGNPGVAMPVLKQWFKIPKGKQTFHTGDRITVNIAAILDGITFCGFSTYKEYK